MATKTAEILFDLFRGLDRAHGATIETDDRTERGKKKAKSWVVHEPPTADLWDAHLRGERGLGIVPIRDDGTARWGAVDVDDYSADLADLCRRARTFPVVVARSKSGGAHLFLFGREDLPADLLRERLVEIAEAVGRPGAEVFPKQSELRSKSDVGNWLNMPYFGGDSRPALDEEGRPVGIETFVRRARSRALTVAGLKELNVSPPAAPAALFKSGPPCLNSLARDGFDEGTRNDATFNVAVYLKKRFPDAWRERLREYNQILCSPPLEESELRAICGSLSKKDYAYTCDRPPICHVCDRTACLRRKFGVGVGKDDLGLELGPMTVLLTDPPTYVWEIGGSRVEFEAEDLLSQKAFQKRCLEDLFDWPNPVRSHVWQKIVKDAVSSAEKIEVPPDATAEGQAWALLDDFCSKARARARDEILSGRAWTEEGKTYFRVRDFVAYLRVRDFPATTRQVYRWLRRRGCESGTWTIKGKTVTWWAVEEFESETEDREVPAAKADF